MPGVLLTQAETAKRLGVTRDRLRRWTRDGIVTADGQRVQLPTWTDAESDRVLYPWPAMRAMFRELGVAAAHKDAS